jgi:hypothetical protein
MASFKIRFVNSKGFVASAISFVTESLFDHAEIEAEDGSWIAAIMGKGICIMPADYSSPTREYRYSIPCTDEQYAKAMAFAHSIVGKSYDDLDILGLLLHDREINAQHAYICSMSVIRCAQAGGIQMLNVLAGWDHLVTPETLHLSPLLIGNRTLKKG